MKPKNGKKRSRTPNAELWTALATFSFALRDLLAFYDRAAGAPGYTGHGWTVAEIRRLAEIRKMI